MLSNADCSLLKPINGKIFIKINSLHPQGEILAGNDIKKFNTGTIKNNVNKSILKLNNLLKRQILITAKI